MTATPAKGLPPAQRRRRTARSLLRSLIATAVLIALYYLSPLTHLDRVPIAVSLVIALLILLAITVWQVRAITRATYPALRAIEALAATVPLFLLLFAASYFLMARADPANFSHPLTRTDALYFTVTVFTTVGFGDITATSQIARILVTIQMLLDLLILGLGIQVFVGAVRLARQTQTPHSDSDPDAGTGRP